jgi:hypothetical protein
MSKIMKATELAELLVQAINTPEQMPWTAIKGLSSDTAYKVLLRDIGFLVGSQSFRS